MQQHEITSLIQGELWEGIGELSINQRNERIIPVTGKATVLVGMRRVGKTFTLLNYLKELDRMQIPRSSILFINLEDAYLAFLVPIYDSAMRVRSTSPKKCYCIDTGMSANYSLKKNADMGRLFENLVFLDLKRQGYRIFYYRTESDAEIDFIIVGGSGHPFVVQVCYDISDDDTRKREESSLEEAKTELQCGGVLITPHLYTQNRD